MSVLSLSPQTLRITRYEEQIGEDSQPVIATVVVASSVPCRLDRGYTRIFSNTLQGDLRSNQLAGTLFLDAESKDDEGNLLNLKHKDVIEIDGRKYEIVNILPMWGFSTLDHYEIAVVDYENK